MCGKDENNSLTVLRGIVWGVNFVFFGAGVLLAAISVRGGKLQGTFRSAAERGTRAAECGAGEFVAQGCVGGWEVSGMGGAGGGE